MREYRLGVPDFARWRRDCAERGYTHVSNVKTQIESARSLLLRIAPCPPYAPTDEGVSISAFYVASNALYRAARRRGVSMPIKSLIAGYGIGAYGRNGVIAIPGIGSQFAAQAVESDEMPDENFEWCEDRGFSAECERCDACVAACPTRALDGTGHVDIEKCLRAQASRGAMPEQSRALIEGDLWGCDICQRVCPRNRDVGRTAMPEGLADAISLKRLLAGDVGALGVWIGTNYARPARMQARACILAANLERRDLIGEIRALLSSESEAVCDCAGWALRKLEG
ncbi:MAG: 4Fe-4S double cluster binding domain-containing protein [Christensenellales bacterium]|jgi:epoxyqueuosine reductase QueG